MNRAVSEGASARKIASSRPFATLGDVSLSLQLGVRLARPAGRYFIVLDLIERDKIEDFYKTGQDGVFR